MGYSTHSPLFQFFRFDFRNWGFLPSFSGIPKERNRALISRMVFSNRFKMCRCCLSVIDFNNTCEDAMPFLVKGKLLIDCF